MVFVGKCRQAIACNLGQMWREWGATFAHQDQAAFNSSLRNEVFAAPAIIHMGAIVSRRENWCALGPMEDISVQLVMYVHQMVAVYQMVPLTVVIIGIVTKEKNAGRNLKVLKSKPRILESPIGDQ